VGIRDEAAWQDQEDLLKLSQLLWVSPQGQVGYTGPVYCRHYMQVRVMVTH
jgi:hypothetical protein